MHNIRTFIVEPGTPELATCARWRANSFSVLQASFEKELKSLELFASDQRHGAALIAKIDGEPIGTCLLAESEIEPNHDVSPWLGGLFVVPEHRRKGAGAVLVRAIEDQARQRGFSRLYLYTTEAVEFYARLGWTVLDHTHWKGFDTVLMVRDLSRAHSAQRKRRVKKFAADRRFSVDTQIKPTVTISFGDGQQIRAAVCCDLRLSGIEPHFFNVVDYPSLGFLTILRTAQFRNW